MLRVFFPGNRLDVSHIKSHMVRNPRRDKGKWLTWRSYDDLIKIAAVDLSAEIVTIPRFIVMQWGTEDILFLHHWNSTPDTFLFAFANKTSLQNLLRAIYRLTRICLAKFIPLAVKLPVKYHLKDSAVFIRCCDYHLVTQIGYCDYFDPQFFAWTQREPITLWQILDIVTILPLSRGSHNIRYLLYREKYQHKILTYR